MRPRAKEIREAPRMTLPAMRDPPAVRTKVVILAN